MDGIGTNQKITRRAVALRLAAAGVALPGFLATGATAHATGARLRVHGAVCAPFDLSVVDLQHLGGETVTAVLECAGSGRVANAAWTGVPLRAVLDIAGAGEHAVAVVARGRDGHRRAIPLRDVVAAGPLLAWARDGESLTASSGGPLRLVVPGWAAEASVKALAEIELVERMPANPGPADPADRRLRPLREMPPRAVIVSPARSETLRAGRREIRGHAWSGYAPIASVAVSTDGGATWRDAEIGERTGPHGWVTFRLDWPARPGQASLAARATDAFGLTQPLDVPDRARGFVHNAVSAVPVIVTR